jgi:hypothetical protein
MFVLNTWCQFPDINYFILTELIVDIFVSKSAHLSSLRCIKYTHTNAANMLFPTDLLNYGGIIKYIIGDK